MWHSKKNQSHDDKKDLAVAFTKIVTSTRTVDSIASEVARLTKEREQREKAYQDNIARNEQAQSEQVRSNLETKRKAEQAAQDLKLAEQLRYSRKIQKRGARKNATQKPTT
jgi:hypothetical protein